jgi:DNA-binding beta-propeller fold protein YncE
LRLSPDGTRLYVALSGSPIAGPGVDESKLPPADRSADGIGVVDLTTGRLVRTLKSGQDPESFDLSSDGTALYVSNEETAQLTAVDIASGEARSRVAVGEEPEGVTLRRAVGKSSSRVKTTPRSSWWTRPLASRDAPQSGTPAARCRGVHLDGATGFVTNEKRRVGVGDRCHEGSGLGPDSDSEAEGAAFPARPMGVALSPDGSLLFVSRPRKLDRRYRCWLEAHSAFIQNVGERPWGITVSRDGAPIFTANGAVWRRVDCRCGLGRGDPRAATGGSPWGVVFAEGR